MATLLIGPTATGSGDGSDWNNLLQWSSFTPVRGNTYYLKNGAYAGRTFATALSGTTLIIIKKATVLDHGPATGWSDAYAAQATFSSGILFNTGYWTFNGQYGVAGLSGVTTTFGFQITTGDVAYPNGTCIGLTGSGSIVSYVEAFGQPSLDAYNYTNSLTCLYIGAGVGSTYSYCYAHGADNLVNTQTGATGSIVSTGVIIDNCVFQASRSSNGAIHSNVFFCTATSGTFSNNLIFNFDDEGVFLTGT
jgi:hypothetical protein